MSQYVESPTKTFVASGALGQYLRVKDNGSGQLSLAGASDVGLGVLELPTFAAAEPATVRLHTAQGTRKMVASEAFATAFATVYAAASGKVATTGTLIVGIAMETASGDDSVFEVLPIPNTDISATITGTNAAVFEADADLAKPRMAIGSQTGGTGDFKAVLRPPTTLTVDRIFTLEGDADATLVNKAGAQTLTDKTLTAPVIAVLVMTGTTGNQEVRLTTNLADALSIEDTAGDLLAFDTTTGAQKITCTPNFVIGTKATGAGATFVPLIPLAAQQAISGPGAINITTFYTAVTTTGADAFTLADGAVIGQLKKIQLIVDGGEATLTPTNLAGGTTITFADAGDYALLGWDGTDWVAIELGNDADGATAPALA
jgi:hypothetical protein